MRTTVGVRARLGRYEDPAKVEVKPNDFLRASAKLRTLLIDSTNWMFDTIKIKKPKKINKESTVLLKLTN